MTRTVLLGDIAQINPEAVTKSYAFDEIVYLDTSSVVENTFSGLQTMKLKDAPSRAKRIIRDGDIVYSTVRPNLKHFGYIKKAPKNMVASTGFAVLRAKSDDVDSRFLYYWLSADERTEYLTSIADSQTSTFPAFNPSVLAKLKLSLPPLKDQKRIADILGTIDEKIELNRRMNETLEQMGQALFRHHFITNPEAKSWDVVKLKDVSSLISRGISPKYDDEGATLVVNQRCIRNKRLDLANARRQSKPFADEKLLAPGDVLINSTGVGTLGRVAQVDEVPAGTTFDSHVTVVRPKTNKYFFGEMLRSLETVFEGMGRGTTGQTELGRQAIEQLQIKLPPTNLVTNFEETLTPLREQMHNNDKEIQTLTILRDTLLPRLISGKVTA